MYDDVIDFIRRLYGVDKGEFVPLHAPVFGDRERQYVLDTIDSTIVSYVGRYVTQTEDWFVKKTGTSGAAAFVNGTCALDIALLVAGVRQGDEVITQGLTFVATANSIAHNGANPVFIDVDLDTMGMSPAALSDFLEEFAEVREDGAYNKASGKRIAACVPMHTFGLMCRVDEIVEICSHYGIPVVEDAAEALGSKLDGTPAGGWGSIGVFSFNGNKIVTAGGGGMTVSKENALVIEMKHLSTTAKVPHKWEYVHDKVGYNYRMPNINAALLMGQLERFEEIRRAKALIFESYLEFFGSRGMTLKPIPARSEWNYWLASLELDNRRERDTFLEATNAQGVMTRPIWRLLHKLPMYGNCQRDTLHNARYLEDRIVNIPSGVS